jgi:hypothetical protein
MVCAKCHKNEAVMHFTICEGDRGAECIDLCEECAPSTGFGSFTIEQLKAFSVVGKRCDFCGEAAVSGQIIAGGGAIYWCLDCGTEFAHIVRELIKAERPDLVQSNMEEPSSEAYCLDSELQAWASLATQKAVRVLKERRGRNGLHTGS